MTQPLAESSCTPGAQAPVAADDIRAGSPWPRQQDTIPPAIAVIVPVFEQSNLLPDLLQCLANQTWRDFELLLIDNAAEPDPLVAEAVASQGALRARVLHCPRPGSYAARNAGVAATAAEWLAFTDADCQPEPAWLQSMMAAALDRPNGILAGAVRLSAGPSPTPWAIFDVVRGIPQERYVRHGYGATANLFVRREVLQAVGGFDAKRFSGGDAEFCRRAGRRDHPVTFVGSAVVTHPARRTWTEVAGKARRVKGGQIAAGTGSRRTVWFLRSLAPPVRDIAGFLGSPHPWSWRLRASAVRLALWPVELAEVARLALPGNRPRRR